MAKIDMKKAKEAFNNYAKNYNPENKKIKLKIAHIGRVTGMAKKIAQSLNLSKEDVELAQLIALLHDIGRFEQVKRYNTFLDKKSVNHGKLGVEILFDEGLIRNFIQDSSYDDIIKKAILNHNRAKIEEGLTERELLHAKIIRDADKADIFYLLTIEDKETVWGAKSLDDQKITKEIYRQFMEDRVIEYKDMQNGLDLLVAQFAYIYDFYFDYTIRYIKEKEYLEKLYNRFEFKDKETSKMYKNIYKALKEFLEK